MLLLACAAMVFATLAHAQSNDDAARIAKENQLRAKFLYNLPKFIEWPASSFANATDPLIIGLCSSTPLGEQLNETVRDRKINGRALVVKHVNCFSDDIHAVHLLYLSATDARRTTITNALKAEPVVTVSESNGATTVGSMIQFALVGDKVSFEINTGVTACTGIKLSAQLQKLASAIRRMP